MALASRKPKPVFEPDQIVVSRMGFAAGDWTVRRGERLRGDHPVVLAQASFFIDANTPRSEWPDEFSYTPPPHEAEVDAREEIPARDRVFATIDFQAVLGVNSRYIRRGQVLNRNDPLVRAHVDCFEVRGPLRDFLEQTKGG
jgi:hypothetical protein